MTRFLVTVSCRLLLLIGAGSLLYLAVIWSYAGISVDFSWFWAAVGLFCILAGLALHRLLAHLDLLTLHRWAAWALSLLFVMALAAAALVVALTGQVVSGMHKEPDSKPGDLPEVVLVLGAQVKRTVPSLSLKMRLDKAADYAQEHPETVFVLTGGKGSGEDISEAECMYRYLKEKLDGETTDLNPALFSDRRFLMEDQSTSTWENLVFSDRLYDLKDKRVGILSNDFHIRRALLLAGKAGYTDVSGIPAPSVLLMQPHNVMREVCALIYMYLSETVKTGRK